MPQSLEPWNWQLPEWPDFRFDEIRLRPLESEFLRRSGVHVGAFSHLEPQEQKLLNAEMLSDEALLTSKIEGELLDRDSLQSSIRRLFRLTQDPANQPLASPAACVRISRVMLSEGTNLDQTPAPPELIAKAEALVREYDAQCFWFWHPDAGVRTVEDIQVVIKELRRNGNRRAWLAAQELQRCL